MTARGNDPLVELLGLASVTRLGLLGLVGGHTVGAPSLAAAHRLYLVTRRLVRQQSELLELGTNEGLEPLTLMRPFTAVLSGLEARTHEADWWEGLLKGVVGLGLIADLSRLLATGLPCDETAAKVIAATAYEPNDDDRVTAVVAAATSSDPVLASRLGLWGRRIVGESMAVTQRLLVDRSLLCGLARDAAVVGNDNGAEPCALVTSIDVAAWALTELTKTHGERMERMGLAA